MGIHTRFLASGIAPLLETISAAGGDPADLRSAIWEAAWSRGYDDVLVPAPSATLSAEAFVIAARTIDAARCAAVVDTGFELWAVVARCEVLPAPGSRVRLSASGNADAPWTLRVLERLHACVRLRFDFSAQRPSNAWIAEVRASLESVRENEALNRQSIEAQRRALPPLMTVASLSIEFDGWHRALKSRIEHEIQPTPAERELFERGTERTRKAVLDACTARRLDRYRAELERLRDELPALRADRERRLAVNTRISDALSRLEHAWSASRAATERSIVMDRELDAIEQAELPADWIGPANGERLPSFPELARTIGLLYDLIPKHAQRLRHARSGN